MADVSLFLTVFLTAFNFQVYSQIPQSNCCSGVTGYSGTELWLPTTTSRYSEPGCAAASFGSKAPVPPPLKRKSPARIPQQLLASRLVGGLKIFT